MKDLIFNNKALVAIVICHFELDNWAQENGGTLDPIKNHHRVPFSKNEELSDFARELYIDWIHPLNFTYSNRYGRLRSTIRFFKNIKQKRRESLIKIYRREMPFIKEQYENIYEHDLQEKLIAKTRRDFMNWTWEYEWPKPI